jgi:FkbM family methyltransferase
VDDCSGDNNCDMHTNGEMRLVRNSLAGRAGVIVFDVGANKGTWCASVLDINPLAEIHCFEPCHSTFEKLMSRDFPGNAVLNRVGLSSCSRDQKMFVFGESHSKNSLHPRHDREPKRYEKVRLKTLVDYCAEGGIEFIDYLKIDVEGHEFAVLLGAERMLSEQRIQVVQFEYGEGYISAGVLLKEVVDYVDSFKYDLYKIMPRGLAPIREYSSKLESFLNSNYVLLSRDNDCKLAEPRIDCFYV